MSQPEEPEPHSPPNEEEGDGAVSENLEEVESSQSSEVVVDMTAIAALQSQLDAVSKSLANAERLHGRPAGAASVAEITKAVRQETRKLRRLNFMLEDNLDGDSQASSESDDLSSFIDGTGGVSKTDKQNSYHSDSEDEEALYPPWRSTGELKWVRASSWRDFKKIEDESAVDHACPAIYCIADDTNAGVTIPPPDDLGPGIERAFPSWVVIRSYRLLIYLLADIWTDMPRPPVELTSYSRSRATLRFAIHRPFKTIIHYDAELRRGLADLERIRSQKAGEHVTEEEYEQQWRALAPRNETMLTTLPSHMEVPHLTSLIRDVRALIGFIDQHIVPVMDMCAAHNLKIDSTINFLDLFHLFPPGSPVFVKDKNVPQKVWNVFGRSSSRFQWEQGQEYSHKPPFVTDAEINDPKPARLLLFQVHCYYIDFDGSRYVPIFRSFDIDPFQGAETVTNLPVLPLPIAEACGLLNIDRCVEMGQEFVAYTRPTHLDYTGRNQLQHPDGKKFEHAGESSADNVSRNFEFIDSEVMVDMERAFLSVPAFRVSAPLISAFHNNQNFKAGARPTWCRTWMFEDSSAWEQKSVTRIISQVNDKCQRMNKDRPPTERDDFLLLPHRVFGFVFRTRKWACLPMGSDEGGDSWFRERQRRIDPWNDLEIPEGHKSLVQSLIASHLEDHPSRRLQFDLVRGKGKGVIVLLHGVPGVGKTTTAECVAEANNRPLYPITCGDLGISPREVEAKLQDAFQLAQLWDCVLLLDEADVFLAQRNEHDIQRNALVSVFLRALEYYQGILFLTSNRIGVFDEAFKSRIHMALYYPPLDWDQTESIWKTHLAKLTNSGLIEFDHADILKYAKVFFESQKRPAARSGPVWNGRQIRNAFQSAVALAAYRHRGTQKILLTRDHFEKVSKVSNQFNDYLWSIQGKTDSDKASSWGIRHDHWVQPESDGHHGPGGSIARGFGHAPRDVGIMGLGFAAAAGGPSAQFVPQQPFQQQAVHHHMMPGQIMTGYPQQQGLQMPMTAQTTGFQTGYPQPGQQGQPQPQTQYFTPQQPQSAPGFVAPGQPQQTSMQYPMMNMASNVAQPGQPGPHPGQVPAQPVTTALNHSSTTFVVGQQPQQQPGPGTQHQQ